MFIQKKWLLAVVIGLMVLVMTSGVVYASDVVQQDDPPVVEQGEARQEGGKGGPGERGEGLDAEVRDALDAAMKQALDLGFDARACSRLGCRAELLRGEVVVEITQESLEAFENEHPARRQHG